MDSFAKKTRPKRQKLQIFLHALKLCKSAESCPLSLELIYFKHSKSVHFLMYVNVKNSGLELCQLMPAKIDALAKRHFYDLLYITLL